jgi:NADPH-dependent 2,4-dienoyl-CoA reductase/sulfur reductase-like enzyme
MSIDGDLVIVGASLAGLRAAEAARTDGFAGTIVLVGEESCPPYDRPPLSKAFLDGDVDDTTFRDHETLVETLGLDLRLGVRATGLDITTRTISSTAGDIAYGALIIATGSAARHLPGRHDFSGVHVLRTVDDARAVRSELDTAQHVVVVGGGFIGSEIAAVARERGAVVTIVEAAPIPLERAVGATGGSLMDLHRSRGIDVRTGVAVSEIVGDTAVQSVVLADGTDLKADLVVVGVGSTPATDWLEGTEIRLDPLDRGVVCDATLWTGVPDVWAAGDVAHWPNAVFERTMRLENWTSAAQQGAHAARNALAAEPVPYETVPYYWSDWADDRIQFVGVPDGEVTETVHGGIGSGSAVVLYGHDDKIVGALTLNEPRHIMKLRRLIVSRASLQQARDLVESIASRRAAAV